MHMKTRTRLSVLHTHQKHTQENVILMLFKPFKRKKTLTLFSVLQTHPKHVHRKVVFNVI